MNEEEFLFLHCRECVNKKPKSKSMQEYDRISVARTPNSILIWCTRHDRVIADFPYIWSHEQKCQCEECKSHE
jgi:hypothetical protein